MILLVEHCNFSRGFRKNYFLQARPSESAMLYENKPRTVHPIPISTNKGNEPILVLWY